MNTWLAGPFFVRARAYIYYVYYFLEFQIV